MRQKRSVLVLFNPILQSLQSVQEQQAVTTEHCSSPFHFTAVLPSALLPIPTVLPWMWSPLPRFPRGYRGIPVPITVQASSRCVAHWLSRSRFHSTTRRKVRHHVTGCLAKTSYPTSRWDVAVTNGHCSRTALPLTRPETQKLAAWEPAVHWAKHFVHRLAPNSPDLNTVNVPSGVLFSRRSTIIRISP